MKIVPAIGVMELLQLLSIEGIPKPGSTLIEYTAWAMQETK